MAGQTATRERLLAVGARLFQRQGFGATGLTQVLAEAKAPKGVLYFHFPGGKEQLAAESVMRSGRELGERMSAVLAGAPNVAVGVRLIGEEFARTLEDSGFSAGCPVATVVLEVAASSESIRAACAEVYSSWLSTLARQLVEGGVPADMAETLAEFVLSALQGALVLARSRRDVEVIRSVTRKLSVLVDHACQGHNV